MRDLMTAIRGEVLRNLSHDSHDFPESRPTLAQIWFTSRHDLCNSCLIMGPAHTGSYQRGGEDRNVRRRE